MNETLCAIVIPVYKELTDKYEELSFRQCLKILHNHPVFLLTHKNLPLSSYERVAVEYNIKLGCVFFDASFFTGIAGYNRLMKSKALYQSFLAYHYILIYQLDAFVFRDELEYWCMQGYDYIGAPLFINHQNISMAIVGNGGLSLRKVSFCLRVLSWKWPLLTYKYYNKIKYLPFILGWENNISYYKKNELNEDRFFSDFLHDTYIHSNLPTPERAAYFAFERYPSYLYQECNKQLPFGCHAFMKYEYDSFWKQFIEDDV